MCDNYHAFFEIKKLLKQKPLMLQIKELFLEY